MSEPTWGPICGACIPIGDDAGDPMWRGDGQFECDPSRPGCPGISSNAIVFDLGEMEAGQQVAISVEAIEDGEIA